MRSSRWASRSVVLPLVFALWTLFVWVGRIRNLAQEPGSILDAGRWSLWGSLLFSALGLALLGAIGVVVADGLRADRAAHRASVPSSARRPLRWPLRWPPRWVVAPLAALTTVVWVVRGIDIATGDHSAGFIVVHVVLAVVSIGLAAASFAATSVGPDADAVVPTADGGTSARRPEGRDHSAVGYPPTDG